MYIDNYEEAKTYNLFDPKSYLQNWAQSKSLPLPTYEVIKYEGVEHQPIFTISLYVEGFAIIIGKGNNKKIATKNAAQLFIKEHKL